MDAKGKLKKAASNRLDTQIAESDERRRPRRKSKTTRIGESQSDERWTSGRESSTHYCMLKCTALLRKEHSQVTPVLGRDRRVRLGVLPPVGRNGVVSSR